MLLLLGFLLYLKNCHMSVFNKLKKNLYRSKWKEIRGSSVRLLRVRWMISMTRRVYACKIRGLWLLWSFLKCVPLGIQGRTEAKPQGISWNATQISFVHEAQQTSQARRHLGVRRQLERRREHASRWSDWSWGRQEWRWYGGLLNATKEGVNLLLAYHLLCFLTTESEINFQIIRDRASSRTQAFRLQIQYSFQLQIQNSPIMWILYSMCLGLHIMWRCSHSPLAPSRSKLECFWGNCTLYPFWGYGITTQSQ